MKNIAIFCDGTWQNFSQRYPTNVSRLARTVAAETGDGRPQIVFYDDGVGVGQGFLENTTRLLGGAFGAGLDHKIAEAYEFLCLNFTASDNVFLFGFSRGAYTARSLAGLIHTCGILRREDAHHVNAAVELYRNHTSDSPEAREFRTRFNVVCIGAETQRLIRYIGVWDTVGSLGIPRGLPFSTAVDARYQFHNLSLSPRVYSARHAVAIDERRDTFAPTLWDNIKDLNDRAASELGTPAEEGPRYRQVWFPGGHGAVGGGENDGGISILPLLWIKDGAAAAGLAFSEKALEVYADDKMKLAGAAFSKEGHSLADLVLTVIGEHDRIGPSAWCEVSESARIRWRTDTSYRPAPLRRFENDLNNTENDLNNTEEED